jgi:hypothetical protein
MANIDINLGQSTISAFNARPSPGSFTMADNVNLFFKASYNFGTSHAYYTNGFFTGSSLRLDFADGAYSQYSGVVLANPNATTGEATATNLESNQPSAYRLSVGGHMNYHYASNADGSLILQGTGGTINDVAIHTQLPSSSSSYDAQLGNVTVGLHGAVAIAQSGDISGNITSLTTSADKLIASSALTGNFSISGNSTNIGQGLASASISGVADSFVERYTDGSTVSLANLGLTINSNTMFSEKLLFDGANLPSNDIVNITLGGNLATPWAVATGAGNDKVMIKGGGATLSVNAGTGNDTITLGDDGHSVDGGAGIDTAVFSGARSAYTVTKTTTGYSVQASGGTDTLAGVERLQFADTTIALDIDGNGGQVYRLYQAAFNRVPDAGGLGFWIHAMDSGAALSDIGAEFTKSNEFKNMYGVNPNNADFLDKLYHNVLHRAGDAGGFDFWLGHLNHNDLSQAQALAEFGESPENQAALITAIGNGFAYTPFG